VKTKPSGDWLHKSVGLNRFKTKLAVPTFRLNNP